MTAATTGIRCPSCGRPFRPALRIFDPDQTGAAWTARSTCWPCLRAARDEDVDLDYFLRAVEVHIPPIDFAPRQLRGYHHLWGELSVAVLAQHSPWAVQKFYLGWLAWETMGGATAAAARDKIVANLDIVVSWRKNRSWFYQRWWWRAIVRMDRAFAG